MAETITEQGGPGGPGGSSGLRGARRRAVRVSDETLVRAGVTRAGQELPAVFERAAEGVDLLAWASEHRERIEAELHRAGGVLFRGFGVASPEEMERLLTALYGGLLEYTDRVQPRSKVSSNVYTSTEYPPDQVIEQHNESSYAFSFPLRIGFLCLLPAEEGGETPLADGRRVFAALDPAVRGRLVERGVMYVRNFGEGFGISWQTAFGTDDRDELEEFCRRNRIALEWRSGGRLRTRSVRPVALRHPVTGETAWFNALISSHESTLDPAVRAALLTDYAPDELPKNAFYGDGSPFEPETLEEIRRAFRQALVAFPWRQGDLLLLDNVLASHGRATYRGPRRVVVGMAAPTSLGELGV